MAPRRPTTRQQPRRTTGRRSPDKAPTTAPAPAAAVAVGDGIEPVSPTPGNATALGSGSGPGNAQAATIPTEPRPVWPYPQICHLTAHSRGYWCKRVRGRLYSFGRIDRPDLALARWQAESPDLYAGRVPRSRLPARLGGTGGVGGCTVGELADQFLESRMDRLDGGELRPNTMRDYLRVVDSIVLGLGRNRRAADLGPADFADLRARAAKRSGPATVGKLVTVVRMLFRFAHDRELVAELPRYGDGFRKPDMLARRRAKRARAQRSDFTAEEIRRLWVGAVEVGDQVMAAMLLLAINGGLGQTDLAQLPISALRLDAPGMGIPHIDFPRPKTEVDRTITLWPETVAALRAALEQRPTPRDGIGTGKSGPVFITGGGWPYVRENVSRVGGAVDAVSRVDAVALAFRRLRQRVHLPADAPGFYGLRHSFITAADSAGDPHAIHRIRGHSLPGMSSVYVERITMDRLRRVTDHVRAWLLDGWSCPWPRGA